MKTLEQKILDGLSAMYAQPRCELNFRTPFQLLVAVILSAQCTDKRVNQITGPLFVRYPTVNDFTCLTPADLKPFIYSCGFYNTKANSIIDSAKRIAEVFGGEVPRTMEELLTLPGVGRKTASVVLAVAFNIPAIPVDTHVFRVAKRLGISDGNDPDEVERHIAQRFPKDTWIGLHHGLIFHGRYTCKSQKPLCPGCLLKDLCAEGPQQLACGG